MSLAADCPATAGQVSAMQLEISTISYNEASTKAQCSCPEAVKPGNHRRDQRKKLHSIHSYVARTGAVAMAASASIITRQVKQFAGADGNSLRSISEGCLGNTFERSLPIYAILQRFLTQTIACLSGVVAQCKHLVAIMADTIGEPPHRPFNNGGFAEEHDAPLSLFWALNLCALCSLASFVLFAATFWAGGPVVDSSGGGLHGLSDHTELGIEDCWITEIGIADREYTIIRVIAVAVLSLFSGLCLGWRHPLQSGLLCGI